MEFASAANVAQRYRGEGMLSVATSCKDSGSMTYTIEWAGRQFTMYDVEFHGVQIIF